MSLQASYNYRLISTDSRFCLQIAISCSSLEDRFRPRLTSRIRPLQRRTGASWRGSRGRDCLCHGLELRHGLVHRHRGSHSRSCRTRRRPSDDRDCDRGRGPSSRFIHGKPAPTSPKPSIATLAAVLCRVSAVAVRGTTVAVNRAQTGVFPSADAVAAIWTRY